MKKRSFVVIGLGTFGATIATELTRMGNHVLGVCSDELNVNRLSEELTEIVRADFRDEDALRDAGVGNHDVAIVAISNDLEASILTTMTVKFLGVETIWVKAMNKAHHRIITKLGVDRVLLPEIEMGQHVAQMLNFPTMRDYMSLGNGFHLVVMNVPSALHEQNLHSEDLLPKFDLKPLGLMRGSEMVPINAEVVPMAEADRLMLLGRSADLREFGRFIGRGK